MHLFRYMKSLASELKAFQSRSKGEIPGRAVDSDAELFIYLIQCTRFGS